MNNYKAKHCCERCGKERPKHIKVDISVDGYIYRDIGWVALRCGSGYERDIDLCEDCMKEFANWISTPPMTNVVKENNKPTVPLKVSQIIG